MLFCIILKNSLDFEKNSAWIFFIEFLLSFNQFFTGLFLCPWNGYDALILQKLVIAEWKTVFLENYLKLFHNDIWLGRIW